MRQTPRLAPVSYPESLARILFGPLRSLPAPLPAHRENLSFFPSPLLQRAGEESLSCLFSTPNHELFFLTFRHARFSFRPSPAALRSCPLRRSSRFGCEGSISEGGSPLLPAVRLAGHVYRILSGLWC